jgi:hypothetical protein
MKPFLLLAASAALLTATPAAAAEVTCQITFGIGTSVQLSIVSANPSYANAPGEFKGESTLVECEVLTDASVSVGDADQARGLSVGIVGVPTAISGPEDMFRCTWIPSSRLPVVSDFDMSEQTAFTPGFQQVNPDFHVSDIECDGTIGSTTTTTELPPAVCGDATGDEKVTATDALVTLRTAVGSASCEACVCDVNSAGGITSSDALAVLRAGVGQPVTLSCGDC